MKKLLAKIKSLFGKSSGFTLIELLVVIAIIGVLMVGTIIAIDPVAQINKSKDANAKGQMDQVASAVNSYYLATNSLYPPTQAALVIADLKAMPAGLTYTASPAGCDNTATNCTGATIKYTLLYNDGTNVTWCWRSSLGKASAMPAASCIP